MCCMGSGYGDVRSHNKEGAYSIFLAKLIEHFISRLPRPRQFAFFNPPHACNVTTRSRIVNFTVARKLIGLLAMLAPTLTITLPGQTAVTAVGTTHQTKGQGDIDVCERIIYPLALLLDTTCREDHRRCSSTQHVCSLHQLCFWHAGQAFHTFRPVGSCNGSHSLEALGSFMDVVAIYQAVADQDMQEAIRQSRIRAGCKTEMQSGYPCGRREARIYDDQFAIITALCLDILHHGRHRLGNVAAKQKHYLRM